MKPPTLGPGNTAASQLCNTRQGSSRGRSPGLGSRAGTRESSPLSAGPGELRLRSNERSLADAPDGRLVGADKLRAALELRKGVAVLRNQAVQERQLRLATARFPASQYRGGEWAAAEADMRTAFAAWPSDKKLHRVGVYSPWDERTEARFRDGHWIIGTYRYVGGHCLARLPDGTYRCYRLSFRRTRLADGSFGPLQVFGVGHSFEVLADNIDK